MARRWLSQAEALAHFGSPALLAAACASSRAVARAKRLQYVKSGRKYPNPLRVPQHH